MFPGYANSSGADGHFYLDTTAYSNGVHTIFWTVADDAGNTDGISSRYFTIWNADSSRKGDTKSTASGETVRASGLPIERPEGSEGFGKSMTVIDPMALTGETNGLTINVHERVMVRVVETGSVRRGYLEVNGRLNPLPIGSTLDTDIGVFFWEPGPSFIGTFPLVFVIEGPNGESYRKTLTVTILPK